MTATLIEPMITKSGKLALWRTAGATAASTGAFPIAPITAINGTPTVMRNGSTVQTAPLTWYNASQDCAFVAALLQCGSVLQLGIKSGGSNMTAPTVTASGGVTLGTPTLATGVTGYTVQNGGTAVGNSSPISVIVDSGGGTGLGALCHTLQQHGRVSGVFLDAGGTSYTTPLVFIAAGTNELLTPTITAGGIASVAVTKGGGGYPASTTLPVAISDPTGSGASYTATINSSGVITALNHVASGSGYTNPIFCVYTTNASLYTATATATQSGGVVNGLTLLNNGWSPTTNASWYTAAPGINVSPPVASMAGPNGAIQAAVEPYVQGNSFVSVAPLVGGTNGCGNGYSTTFLPAISLTGSGALFQIHLTGTVISSVTVVAGGSGFGAANVVNVADPAGTGAVLTLAVVGGAITAVGVTNGGTGYTGPSLTIGPAGSTVQIPPAVSQYIAYVPVTGGGSNLLAPPTFSVSDSTGSGASFLAIMSGVLSTDTMTYSAPANWLTCNVGGVNLSPLPSATNAAMANYVGQYEPAIGGAPIVPTMLAGANVGEQAAQIFQCGFTGKNRLKQADNKWQITGGGVITFDSLGNPSTWTNPTASTLHLEFYNPTGSNQIDQMGPPSHYGQWTLQYTDPLVNTTGATMVWLQSFTEGSQQTVTQINQSGPNVGTSTAATVASADITIAGGLVTAVGVSHSSLGSGYTDAPWRSCRAAVAVAPWSYRSSPAAR